MPRRRAAALPRFLKVLTLGHYALDRIERFEVIDMPYVESEVDFMLNRWLRNSTDKWAGVHGRRFVAFMIACSLTP